MVDILIILILNTSSAFKSKKFDKKIKIPPWLVEIMDLTLGYHQIDANFQGPYNIYCIYLFYGNLRVS